ncbi:MAG TPA: SIS domain-containing protein [bacterium]|nr:SIS domain-containing protein [bacterium]
MTQQFLERVREYHDRIAREEAGRIAAAARRIADCIGGGGLVHVTGPGGHSMLAAEECFYRAGGFVPIDAILDDGFWLGAGAARSTRIERTPGYTKAILDGYPLRRGDVLMIVNAYGVNAATIDAAAEGRARGLATIGVTFRRTFCRARRRCSTTCGRSTRPPSAGSS